jgi:hypothetical protein
LLTRTGEVEHRPDLIDGRRPWKNSGRKKKMGNRLHRWGSFRGKVENEPPLELYLGVFLVASASSIPTL